MLGCYRFVIRSGPAESHEVSSSQDERALLPSIYRKHVDFDQLLLVGSTDFLPLKGSEDMG